MKTKKQFIKEIKNEEIPFGNDKDTLFCNRIGMYELVERVANESIEFAQRWIPIEEELPPLNTYILTKGTKDKQVYYNSIIMTKLPPIDILKQFYSHWRLIELE